MKSLRRKLSEVRIKFKKHFISNKNLSSIYLINFAGFMKFDTEQAVLTKSIKRRGECLTMNKIILKVY